MQGSITVLIGLSEMFDSTEREISDRIRQSKDILTLVTNLSAQAEFNNSDVLKIQKGYLFVSLYSSIEYCITATVSRFLEIIKLQPRNPLDYKRYILCTMLNSNFNAIRDSSKKNIWDKKSSFIDSLFDNNPVSIDTSVFPTDGSNISDKQIQDIWKFFHLSGHHLPEGVTHFLLSEVKEHRNAIAHGRDKAINIGSRYTLDTLIQKEALIESLCFHILEQFKTLYNTNGYLENSGE